MYIIIYTFQSIKFVILGGLGKKIHPSTCIPIFKKPPFPLHPIFFLSHVFFRSSKIFVKDGGYVQKTRQQNARKEGNLSGGVTTRTP